MPCLYHFIFIKYKPNPSKVKNKLHTSKKFSRQHFQEGNNKYILLVPATTVGPVPVPVPVKDVCPGWTLPVGVYWALPYPEKPGPYWGTGTITWVPFTLAGQSGILQHLSLGSSISVQDGGKPKNSGHLPKNRFFFQQYSAFIQSSQIILFVNFL